MEKRTVSEETEVVVRELGTYFRNLVATTSTKMAPRQGWLEIELATGRRLRVVVEEMKDARPAPEVLPQT